MEGIDMMDGGAIGDVGDDAVHALEGLDAGAAPPVAGEPAGGGKAFKVVAVLLGLFFLVIVTALGWHWFAVRRESAAQEQLTANRPQQLRLAPMAQFGAQARAPAMLAPAAGSAPLGGQRPAVASSSGAMLGAAAPAGSLLDGTVASSLPPPSSMAASTPMAARPAGAADAGPQVAKPPIAAAPSVPVSTQQATEPAGAAAVGAGVDERIARLQQDLLVLRREVRALQVRDRSLARQAREIREPSIMRPAPIDVRVAAITVPQALLRVDGQWVNVRAGSDIPGVGKVLQVRADGVQIQGRGWLKP